MSGEGKMTARSVSYKFPVQMHEKITNYRIKRNLLTETSAVIQLLEEGFSAIESEELSATKPESVPEKLKHPRKAQRERWRYVTLRLNWVGILEAGRKLLLDPKTLRNYESFFQEVLEDELAELYPATREYRKKGATIPEAVKAVVSTIRDAYERSLSQLRAESVTLKESYETRIKQLRTELTQQKPKTFVGRPVREHDEWELSPELTQRINELNEWQARRRDTRYLKMRSALDFLKQSLGTVTM